MQVLSYTLLNTRNQQVIKSKLPFLCLFHKHMMKHLKRKPGSSTAPISANISCAQNNASNAQETNDNTNKPFALMSSVPHNEEMSAFFPHMTIEARIFPIDHDDKTMHTAIGNKLRLAGIISDRIKGSQG